MRFPMDELSAQDAALLDAHYQNDQLKEFLYTYITDNKRSIFAKVLPERTHHLTLVLEDIYQSQNASAVVRSADCFGIQDVYVIEERESYKLNAKVLKGSAKWVDIHRSKSAEQTYAELKAKGYKLAATTPHTDMTLDMLPLDAPVALMLGNEENGLRPESMEQADYRIRIPMYGFTESLNVSVSAAICLNHLVTKVRNNPDIDWRLTELERRRLEMLWIFKIIGRPDLLIAQYLREQEKGLR